MVLLILSTFFLNASLICCATYWLMQDADHHCGRVDRDSYVKNAIYTVYVWEKLNYINAVAMYAHSSVLFAARISIQV
jgi:hypothetical protein